MDKQLLAALGNISDALEFLVDALNNSNDKKEETSPITKALASGDFGKQLEKISTSIEGVKSDTSKILEQQETIIKLQKEASANKKDDEVEKAGGSKEQMKKIAAGVGIIILIAGAVLAIGMAFKIIGKVDFLSVISLSIAILIISKTFGELLQIPGLDEDDAWKRVAMAGLSLVAISIAIVASSFVLGFVQPIGMVQAFSAILVAGILALAAYAIEPIAKGIREIKTPLQAALMAGVTIIMLPALAMAIVGASLVLGMVKPVGLIQAFSAILVAGILAVAAYAIGPIAKGMKDIKDPVSAAIIAGTMVLLLPALATSIAFSSWILGSVQPVGLVQFWSALLISILFVVLSFGIRQIITAFKNITPTQALMSAITIPVLLIAIAGTIALSSYILNEAQVIDKGKLLNILLMGGTLVILSTLTMGIMWVINKFNIGIGTILKGALVIVAIAGTIAISSHILNWGKYDNHPSIGWVFDAASAILAFGLLTVAIGGLIALSGGTAALFMGIGAVAVIGLAGTILAVSQILSKGIYNSKGMFTWALSTALLYATFTPIMLVLGAAMMASEVISIFGPNPWELANQAILDVAETIVLASEILATGTYTGGPNMEWAGGIALAMGAFSPVYAMLMANKIFSLIGGGIGPDDFSNAIMTVSGGIVSAGEFFAKAENAGVWGAHPSKEWAEGVGTAIGAFAPVYAILMEQKGGFFKKADPGLLAKFAGEYKDGKLIKDGAIQSISRGIISAAEFFSEHTAEFNENYPKKEWGEGVGAAIGAFAPVFEIINGFNFFSSGEEKINQLIRGISKISRSMVNSAIILAKGNWDSSPNPNWVSKTKKSLKSYLELVHNYKDVKKRTYAGISRLTYSMYDTAKKMSYIKNITIPEVGDIIKMSKGILVFNSLINHLTKSETGGMMSFLNSKIGNDPITKLSNRMITLAKGYNAMATSLMRLSQAIKLLNLESAKELGGVTSSILAPSEVNRRNVNKTAHGESVNIGGNRNEKKSSNIQTPNGMLEEKLDTLIELLTVVSESSVGINDLLGGEFAKDDEDPQVDKSGGKKKKGINFF